MMIEIIDFIEKNKGNYIRALFYTLGLRPRFGEWVRASALNNPFNYELPQGLT